ncbi:hypothetical protein HanPSC8_Chr11g0499071 [Helianthus annuus]|nr:hypothetical protein HanPSC8_Chr11g0499071 [Helianthus annuus]
MVYRVHNYSPYYTTGRLPSQRLDPALPKFFWFTPTFPTCPTVAEQFLDIKRTSLEGNFNVADFPSFAISFATAPAALANCPPFPSVISMLCMAVPKGISVEGISHFYRNFCTRNNGISNYSPPGM